MKKLLTTIFMLLLIINTIFPQVTADLTIENQQVSGTDFFFDIYITRTGTNDVYLGNADFILTFDTLNFSSPVLSKEPATAPGLCTFVPTDQSGLNTLFLQYSYYNNTALDPIVGNELIINLAGPTPGDVSSFNSTVAWIDDSPSTHRLGRFKVSGIINASGYMNLQWKTSGMGVTTQVFTLDPTDLTPPIFESSEVIINAIDPANAPLPIELTSFTGSYKNSEVMLSWKTETEVNNYGFNVERRIGEGEWNTISFVAGSGNSNSPKEYSYSDKDLFAGGSKFQYRLKQMDNDGSFEYSEVVELELVPNEYELSQNYPNPFNPSTTIRFSLPKQTQLKINIYNMLGELVETIAEGTYEAGYYKVNINVSNLPSGAYIYRIESAEFVQVKKLILLK